MVMNGNPSAGALRELSRPVKAMAYGLAALALAAVPARGGSWEIGDAFPAPSSQTNGLTWDGQALWHTNDNNPIVYRIDPNTGKVLGTVESQIADQGDMEFAGGSLWIVSEDDHYVKRIDPKSGATIDSIKVLGMPDNPPGRNRFPLYQLEGVTFDGRNLWLDGNHSTIIRIDLKSRTEHMYTMPYDMGYLDGMTWAFDHLWIVTNNAVIYEIDPCSMGILDKFGAPANVSAGPEGFAFDGENLWFADNDRDEIYKIILKDKLLTKRGAGAAVPGPASAAPAGPGLAKSAACNEGTLLEAVSPVPLAGGESDYRGRISRNALSASPAWRAGPRGFADALGRARAFPPPGER
jgi:streptogramin lyase